MNNKAIISAIVKSIDRVSTAINEKSAKYVNDHHSVENVRKFFQDISVTPSTKLTLEEARSTSVKNLNPTTYDRYDPIYGLHEEKH